jgi:hypothetical protein
MPHTSAILAASLSWDDAVAVGLQPVHRRLLVQDESMAWQNLSQYGADAERMAMPSVFQERFTLNGRLIEVPTERGRLPAPNRLLEIHGLAGAIGEQLGLAWTSEQDVQRFRATSEGRDPSHQRLIQRALSELAGHFVLGGAHSLGNFTLRLLMLNDAAATALNRTYPRAQGFRPGSDEREAWRSLNDNMVRRLVEAADMGANEDMVATANALRRLYEGEAFRALEGRRGMDYHRRRPQSVEHVSPRRDVIEHFSTYSTFSMPAPSLEPEANAEAVHQLVVAAMDAVQGAMTEIRGHLGPSIRGEDVTYIFDW